MSTGILPSELRDSYHHLLYSVLGCTNESPIVLALRRAGFEGDPFSLVYFQDNNLGDLRYERVVDDDNRSDDGPDSVSGAPTIILEEVPLFERNLVGLLCDYVNGETSVDKKSSRRLVTISSPSQEMILTNSGSKP